MSAKYQYMLVDPVSGKDIGVFLLDEPLNQDNRTIFVGAGPSRKSYFFRDMDDDAPSEESVRFHEDQIERFEKNIEEMQREIEIHQKWLDEHFPYRGIGMTDNDLYVIRDALTRSLQANDGIPYGLSVKEVYRKINNQIAINEANVPRNYPEMMKYPGKITVGDHVGGFTKND